ncbi:transporter [Flavobacterium sp. SUN046]|uniref:transporter n=1 Tax=Flavobacterium sp. SUN046 TaxID=3002440 RepID=UPI002DB8BCAA|nr:transporter [Flavobacterium sp. SUN046]MEC4049538.1 transporter [Flavobacterium sp. SUN046]
MKKILFILLFAFQLMNAGVKDTIPQINPFQKYYAVTFDKEDCDACGCSASGGSMGFSSMLNNNFIGVRYVYQSYTAKEGVFNNSPWVDENFNTVQVWGRIPISKHIQITTLIPFHDNYRDLPATGKQTISGLGDLTVMGMYTVFQTPVDSIPAYAHKLQFGVGVKAPTGKYNLANNGTLNPSFQLGTGSWDYLLVTEYVLKRKQLGLNNVLSYTFKTENQKQYQFGNQLNYGSTLFYLLDLNSVKLVPQAGLAGEVYEANKQVKQEVLGTKGDILFSKFGVEAGRNNWSIGINTMLPINQNLTGGNVKANYRWSINLNYKL